MPNISSLLELAAQNACTTFNEFSPIFFRKMNEICGLCYRYNYFIVPNISNLFPRWQHHMRSKTAWQFFATRS